MVVAARERGPDGGPASCDIAKVVGTAKVILQGQDKEGSRRVLLNERDSR